MYENFIGKAFRYENNADQTIVDITNGYQFHGAAHFCAAFPDKTMTVTPSNTTYGEYVVLRANGTLEYPRTATTVYKGDIVGVSSSTYVTFTW